mgnify:CR=1 FL=1
MRLIGYHRFIGRTAGAGSSLKSNAKASADSDLLASLDFNNVTASATGTFTDEATGTKATINGAAAVTASKDGTTAAQLGSGFWLNVTKSDDSAVLKGLDAVTISYDSKSASTNQGWSVLRHRIRMRRPISKSVTSA